MNKIETIENILSLKLGPNTTSYLQNKDAIFKKEDNQCSEEFNSYCGFQAAHIASLPYKIVSLAVQTISDLAIFTFSAFATLLTLGFCREVSDSLKVRAFNLFVADTATWLSIPFSLFWSAAFKGANSIHLGTVREVDASTLLLVKA